MTHKMNITITESGDDCGGSQEIVANFDGSTKKVNQLHGDYMEPEDRYRFRDINLPTNYLDIIRMAYNAGKSGAELDVKIIKSEEL